MVFVLLIGFGCSGPKNQPEVVYVYETIYVEPTPIEDSYYVKYTFNQRTNYYSAGTVKYSYTTAGGTVAGSETSSVSETFVVGPIKKGFQAKISVSFVRSYMGTITSSIYVSKNDGDYVLKKTYKTPENSTSGGTSFVVGE